MVLQMIGIDYEKADIDTRALFSFQNQSILEALSEMKEKIAIQGIVILSTCNRTEIYCSSEERKTNLFDVICEIKHLQSENYKKYTVEREGDEAVHHLFQLASGMKSKVFGEDQIITQVKKAIEIAREVDATDVYLERLFQSAITAAKKIKSTIRLTAVNSSVVEEMKQALKKSGISFENSQCLVIGNGEIGRLAATMLVNENAKVTVTVRNYKTRQVEIPKGCKVIDYADRLQRITEYDVIVSATASPHHTLKFEECSKLLRDGKHRYLIDLAVPRDISSAFAQEENVTLFDIDMLGEAQLSRVDHEALSKAMDIIAQYESKFFEQIAMQDYYSIVQSVAEQSGQATYNRIKKEIVKNVDDTKQQEIEKLVKLGAQKTISSMLFEIKKQLPEKCWDECINAMKDCIEEQLY